ncbi:MAG TPA: 2-hydroxyglutaryl-CoA dehydratase [Desulfitobacterium dehalogenans]|uniref:2-hydroxyglutaryl-CoA dehydratase n=1 Tax=Desulfitobacterium dehalogenans TaxID=36854 RepID=A0A7C6Z4C8_9FIRM|nr:2-hydroxyglutaryl-CoA dehydratase [Desulfitobacterium dehalogenans]
MAKCYLGVDSGSISTKGVIMDQNNKILAERYLWTEGNPVDAVKEVIGDLQAQIEGQDIQVKAVGTTGSARRLIGALLNAQVVKNEITAHAVGTLSVYPDVRTIFEIGGQDSKIILVEDGIVVDYAMNTLCAAGTGSFLSSQAKRLGLEVEEFGEIALRSQNPTKIAARCTVFAESDMVHKAQIGHKKEDIVAGLCKAVVANYLNNVGKGKHTKAPIVFQGGVSKNVGVIKAFEEATGETIHVDRHAHLMGALGAALLAKSSGQEQDFDFSMTEMHFDTRGVECQGCPNNCEVICIYRNEALIDAWGNKCDKGAVGTHEPNKPPAVKDDEMVS